MFGLGGLAARDRQPEVMDQPGLEERRHIQALRGLAHINWWSGSAGILWRPIGELTQESQNPLRVLDVATGGGDVPIRLWRKARRAGFSLDINGCDVSPTALAFAERQVRTSGGDVHFFRLDVVNEPLPEGYDILTCSLFLHHLNEEQAVTLLWKMGQVAKRMVLINDLRRSALGYFLAYFGSRVLSTSPVVHIDGPLSVRAAFTVEEVRALAERAGLAGAVVARRWPCRLLLTWRRPS